MMKKNVLWLCLILCSLLVAGHLVASSSAKVDQKTTVKRDLVATEKLPMRPSASGVTLTGVSPIERLATPVDPSVINFMTPLSAVNPNIGGTTKENLDISARLGTVSNDSPTLPVRGATPSTLSSDRSAQSRAATVRPVTEAERNAAREALSPRAPVRSLDQGGEDCANATVIASLPFASTGTTAGYADDYNAVCPYTNTGATDVVYEFTPTVDVDVDISLCTNSAYDTKVYVYEGSCASGTEIGCNDDNCSTPSYPDPYVSFLPCVPLTANNTYYIVVDGYSAADAGNYTLDVSECNPCTPLPPNDFCSDAIPLTLGTQYCQQGVVCDLLECAEDIPAVWNSFTVTECSDVEVNYCGSGGTTPNAYANIFDNCLCAGGNAIGFSSFNSTDCGDGNYTVNYTNLAAGTYYIAINPALFPDYCVQVNATPCASCEITCVNNEGEPPCADEYVDNYNGGCNSDPVVFQDIQCGQEICGESGNFTVAGVPTRDTDWYRLTLATEQYLTWKVVSEFAAQCIILSPGPVDPCTDIVQWASAVTSLCDTTTITACLPAGEYWLWIGPTSASAGVACGSAYYFYTTCEPCPECNTDQVITEPIPCTPGTPLVLNGSTIGGDDDCADGIADEIWEITIATEGRYTFDMCATDPNWDAVMWISETCCGEPICFDDDGCGVSAGPPVIECCYLLPGTYYIMVEGFAAGNEGDYVLSIECCESCDIVCPATATIVNEGEACPNVPDTYNTGCAGGDPNVVVNGPVLACNQDTVCANAWTQGDTLRDVDYFELTVDADTTLITWTVIPEFPAIVQLVSTDAAGTCASVTVLAGVSGSSCDTISVSACVDNETTGLRYFGVVAPSGFSDPPETFCGDYLGWSTCEPCVIDYNECINSRITGALAYYSTGVTGNWTWFDLDDATEFPYKPTGITFSLYYPVAGTVGDETTVLITYGCAFFGDVCNAPSDVLCAGQSVIVRDVATANYMQTVDLDLSTLTCCLTEDFWVGVEVIDYVGTTGAEPSFLWSANTSETIPDCEQWLFDGAYGHWPQGSLGWQDVEITGACGSCLGDPELACAGASTLDCVGAPRITCSDTGPQVLAGETNVGGTTTANFYGCTPWDESGPEIVYEMEIPQGGGVLANISNFIPVDIDLDIFLLSACDPSVCVTAGDLEINAVNLDAGVYYIVVDGFAGDEGSFDLTIDLPCTPPGQCLPTVTCGTGLLDPDAILIWDGELLPNGNTAWLSQGTIISGNDMVVKITDPSCALVSTVDLGGATILEVGRSIAFDPRDDSWWMGTFTDATPNDVLRHYDATGVLVGSWTLADFPGLTLVPSLNIPGLAFDTDNNHLWAFTSHESFIEWDVTVAAAPTVIQEGPAAPNTVGNARSSLDYDEANDRLFSCNFVGTLGLGDIECWSDDDPAGAGGITFENACRIQPGGITQDWGMAMSSVEDEIQLANLDAVANTDHTIWTTGAPCLAAPCEAATNLTVIRNGILNEVTVRWDAPHAETWNVYKSTDPNNTGDITHPSYVFETGIVGGPGPLSWTDTAALGSYVNYLVVPSCYQP